MIKQKQKGLSLIDVIISVAIFMIVFIGIFGIFKLSIELVSSSKAKTGALALANEQMEFIRSLSYNDAGTIGGIPSGSIQQEEVIELNQTTYIRRTFIQYADDPKDGLEDDDENSITADYKTIKVELKWTIGEKEKKLSLVSNMVPKGIETFTDGGILIINVIDAFGMPVASAQVTIKNSNTNPAIDLTTFSSASGKVKLQGVPVANNYEILVTKSGYSIARTYDADAENPNPSPGHLTVADEQTTSSSFAIDILSSKTIKTWNQNENPPIPLGNVSFSMRGEKAIGSDGQGAPIYKYSALHETDSSGEITINNLEWDNYTIAIDDAFTGYDISESCFPQPRSIFPNVSTTTDIYLVPDTEHSLLIIVIDEDETLLDNANTRLYRTGFDNTKNTSECGQAFFGGLSKGTIFDGNPYAVDVSRSGYENKTVADVDVDGASEITILLEKL